MTYIKRSGESSDNAGDPYIGLDRFGRVAYKGGRGLFGDKPGEMEQSLIMLLLDEAAASKGR